MQRNKPSDRSCEGLLSRRQLVATTGAVFGAGLAGCSQVTSQTFEASQVRLPEQAQEELVVAETAFDSKTVTRNPSVGGIEGEVTITSHGAVNERGTARGRPTLVETFLGRVNDTTGAGAARVVTGDDAGLGEVTLDFFEEAPTIPDARWSLVVPAAARNDGETTADELLAMVPGTAIPGTRWVPTSTWIPGSRWVPGNEWVPGDQWVPGNEWVPGDQWFPGSKWVPDDPDNLQVLVLAREGSFVDTFGVSAEEMGGRPLDEGESVPAENTVIAVPGDQWAPSDKPDWVPGDQWVPGVPAPTGGATFGLGVLSTPAGKVAGQSLNPIADMGFEELLTSDQFRGLLEQAGVTDAESVEWLRGPNPAGTDAQGAVVLGQETELRSFSGVVSGTHGPWGVGVHLARVEHEGDIVIAAGTHTTPVGAEALGQFPNRTGAWFQHAAEMTVATDERLVVSTRGE